VTSIQPHRIAPVGSGSGALAPVLAETEPAVSTTVANAKA
jgi:hypothetical protein